MNKHLDKAKEFLGIMKEMLSEKKDECEIAHLKDRIAMQEWLIEQAERVQELERDVREWEIVNEQWEQINTQIAEQNKRYREHFDWIIQNSTDKYAVQASYEALEDDLE